MRPPWGQGWREGITIIRKVVFFRAQKMFSKIPEVGRVKVIGSENIAVRRHPPPPTSTKNPPAHPSSTDDKTPGRIQNRAGVPPSCSPAGWGESPPLKKIVAGGGYPHPPSAPVSNAGLPAHARAAVRVEPPTGLLFPAPYPLSGSRPVLPAAGGGAYPHPPPTAAGGSPPFRKNHWQGEGGADPPSTHEPGHKPTRGKAMTRQKFNDVERAPQKRAPAWRTR